MSPDGLLLKEADNLYVRLILLLSVPNHRVELRLHTIKHFGVPPQNLEDLRISLLDEPSRCCQDFSPSGQRLSASMRCSHEYDAFSASKNLFDVLIWTVSGMVEGLQYSVSSVISASEVRPTSSQIKPPRLWVTKNIGR